MEIYYAHVKTFQSALFSSKYLVHSKIFSVIWFIDSYLKGRPISLQHQEDGLLQIPKHSVWEIMTAAYSSTMEIYVVYVGLWILTKEYLDNRKKVMSKLW